MQLPLSRMQRIGFSLIFLMLCASVYTQFIAVGVGDTMISLVSARMLFMGKQLYRDVFTVQQPLIIWIYMLPVGLARLVHLPDKVLVVLIGLSVVASSVYTCNRVLAAHPCFADDDRNRSRHVLLLLSVFITAANPTVFFDREHIFLLLILPYLLRLMPSLANAKINIKLRIVIGCMAGVGFCMKPHCAIVFVAIQLLCWMRTRRLSTFWTIENQFIYLTAMLYAASIFLLTPDYIYTVLPMTLETYSAASMRINGLFYIAIALVLLGIAFADFRWRAASPYRRDIYYLLALCPAFLLYALTNNGWGYTYNPLISFILILTGWVGLEYIWLKRDAEEKGMSGRPFLLGARACALSLAAVMGFSSISGFYGVATACTEHLKCSRVGRELIAAVGDAPSFGVISGDFDIWARLSDATQAHWDTRFNHLWMMPKFFISGPDFTQRHRWVLEYVENALAVDMNIRKPEVIFVDNADIFYLTPVHVDLIAYFSAFPAFKEAWGHYRHVQSISTCSQPQKVHCNFEVYRRLH